MVFSGEPLHPQEFFILSNLNLVQNHEKSSLYEGQELSLLYTACMLLLGCGVRLFESFTSGIYSICIWKLLEQGGLGSYAIINM